MLSIFRRNNFVNNLEWLGIDVHSHLLPIINDDSLKMSTSIDYIKQLNNFGIQKIYLTPLVLSTRAPDSISAVLPAIEKLKQALQRENVEVLLSGGAKYLVDSVFRVTNSMFTIYENHVYIQLPLDTEPSNLNDVVFNLQIQGYNVILAHPERYRYYHKNYSKLQRFKERGVLFQLNLLSMTGYYGKSEQVLANYILSKGYYDLACSDLQNEKELQSLIANINNGFLYNKVGKYPFKNKYLF